MRIRLDLSYDGTDFHGWAAQPGLRTVEDLVSLAIGTALRIPPATLVCAGRTDTGVHARGQVVHVDVAPDVVAGSTGRSREAPMDALRRRLNGILPSDVHVRRCAEVPDAFDARFSALWRRYAYRIADRPEALDPLARQHVLVGPRDLDLAAMNAAAEPFAGLHDFAAFCRRREGATTIRTVLDLVWGRTPEGLAVATVRADAFCHSMVRALVGCLIDVGEGRQGVEWPERILGAGVRDPSVTVAPARGLTLEEVAYPPDVELDARRLLTRARRGPA